MNYDQAALVQFVKIRQPELYGKIVELRIAVKNWLAYIPQTFPHYTRHTVEHSDAIILQMSKLLFEDNDPAKSVIALSPMEAYIAAAAAFLHDSGMVVSDEGKEKILETDEWQTWTTRDGAGADRWEEIRKFRNGVTPPDETLRHFLADVQVRFLIAEFVRRTHHLRAKDILSKNEDHLGRFAFHDPVLLKVIGDVCVAHGLQQRDLEDRDQFPDRRDVLGHEVNVQFLAILLRLGDLLDMSYDRACPLLLSAACPLPPESLAHWTQYQRITHRLTAPDCIEITAECNNQEEHRFLADWCNWLVNEVSNASVLMARSHRHQGWQLPLALLDGNDSTIHIRPAPNAKYIPSKWKFELDAEAVFARLIGDIYEDPNAFIRELIQNALDATRCRLYLELKKDGEDAPEFPTQVPEDRRAKLPIAIRLEHRQVKNDLSGTDETRQALVVEDLGIGMDKDIIQRYFLQVGRSFYTTNEFQKSFRFVPTSRFGLGFLSVFGVSDRVVVDTYKPSSTSGDGPLRIGLTGPKNYLLTEKGTARPSGTRIEVLLREPLGVGQLSGLVSNWCRKVEFPILVDELGAKVEIRAEKPNQFLFEMPCVTQSGASFLLRRFDIERHGVEGELYVIAYVDETGERWDLRNWSQFEYHKLDPRASKPPIPRSISCIHGINLHGGEKYYFSSAFTHRLDFRDGSLEPTLSREGGRYIGRSDVVDPRIISRCEEILLTHLQSPRARAQGWKYRQALIGDPSLEPFWAGLPETLAFRSGPNIKLCSLNEAIQFRQFGTIVGKLTETEWSECPVKNDVPFLTYHEREHISDEHRRALFNGKSIQAICWLRNDNPFILWSDLADREVSSFVLESRPAYFVPFGTQRVIGMTIHKTTEGTYSALVLNSENKFVSWIRRIRTVCSLGEYGLSEEHFAQLFVHVYNFVDYSGGLKQPDYLRGWQQMTALPEELRPPLESLSIDMLRFTEEELKLVSCK